MKKLLVLLVIVGLGLVAAKRLATPEFLISL